MNFINLFTNDKKNSLKQEEISLLIKQALAEDIGRKDITTDALIPADKKITAEIRAKERNFVICGLEVVKKVFQQLDKDVKVVNNIAEGEFIKDDLLICMISGQAQAILKGERTALNFLGRLSGIATKTNRLVKKIEKYKSKILDTRKTTPGLRMLEKYAVKTGGGYNHRFGLFDQVLIKDNHIKIVKLLSKHIGLDDIVGQVKKKVKSKKIIVEIEVKNLEELKQALEAEPDIVMLDNMSLLRMKQAVGIRNMLNKHVQLEASGNINENNIVKVARCGVDYISLGMLTHSVTCIDFSLKVKEMIGSVKSCMKG